MELSERSAPFQFDGCHIVDYDGHKVAQVSICDLAEFNRVSILLAAAPELLGALAQLLAVQFPNVDWSDPHTDPLVRCAGKLIRKVTGNTDYPA